MRLKALSKKEEKRNLFFFKYMAPAEVVPPELRFTNPLYLATRVIE